MDARIACGLSLLLLSAGCGVEVKDVDAPESPPAAPTAAQPLFPQPPAQVAGDKHSGGLSFVKGFDEGYRQAVKLGKPMLIFFTAEWCHYCHQMAADAFTNPSVIGLADRFVCIMVDADAEPEVCARFGVEGYPTVQFVSPRGIPLNTLVGRKPADQLRSAMQSALQNVALGGGKTVR